MDRITDATLRAIALRINKAMGSPEEPYTKNPDGSFHANPGNYHISGAYGGVCLHRMYNTAGGVSDVFSGGYAPKRSLAERMYAFLKGIEAAQDAATR